MAATQQDINKALNLLQPKIIEYLKHKLKIVKSSKSSSASDREKAINDKEIKNLEEAIYFFEVEQEKGLCVGMSVHWAYSTLLSEKSATTKPRDDLIYFNNMIIKISKWNEEQASLIPKEEDAEIERFISMIRLFHVASWEVFGGFGGQLDLVKVVEITGGQVPKKDVEEFMYCDQAMLAEKIKLLLATGQTNFVLANGHAVAFYLKKDGKIYFFDLNTGEQEVKDYEELAKIIWGSLKRRSDGLSDGIFPFDHYGIRKFMFRSFLSSEADIKKTEEKNFSMSAQELLRVLKEKPIILGRFGERGAVSEFINQLSDKQLIIALDKMLLDKKEFSEKLKIIVEAIFEKIDYKTDLLCLHLLKLPKGLLTQKQVGYLKSRLFSSFKDIFQPKPK